MEKMDTDYGNEDFNLNKLRSKLPFFDYLRLENRKASFESWPYADSSPCNVQALAKAGYIMSSAKTKSCFCFMCLKELEGFEKNDDPLSEHKSHSPNCPFLQMAPFEQQTVSEMYNSIGVWANFLFDNLIRVSKECQSKYLGHLESHKEKYFKSKK